MSKDLYYTLGRTAAQKDKLGIAYFNKKKLGVAYLDKKRIWEQGWTMNSFGLESTDTTNKALNEAYLKHALFCLYMGTAPNYSNTSIKLTVRDKVFWIVRRGATDSNPILSVDNSYNILADNSDGYINYGDVVTAEIKMTSVSYTHETKDSSTSRQIIGAPVLPGTFAMSGTNMGYIAEMYALPSYATLAAGNNKAQSWAIAYVAGSTGFGISCNSKGIYTNTTCKGVYTLTNVSKSLKFKVVKV